MFERKELGTWSVMMDYGHVGGRGHEGYDVKLKPNEEAFDEHFGV